VTNTQAFATILAGIQSQDPNLLFFNGDMIFGYGRPTLPTAWANGKPNSWTTAQTVSPDTIFEIAQYAYWRGLVAPLFLTGTYVMPVPGNHETQCSYSAEPYTSGSPNPNCNTAAQGNLTGKTAYADNENMFRFNMGDLVADLSTNIRFSDVTGYYALSPSGLTQATAPAASTNNGPITSNQAELSYSFDIQAQPGLLLHFAVINTDPAGADSTAPTDWLASDLAAAKARGAAGNNVTKYFVFGHKPAFTYNYAAATGGSVNPPTTNSPGPGGLDANYVTSGTAPNLVYTQPYRNAFWSVIVQYGATYFSGHEHTVNVSQNADPTGTYPGTPYQVIVGIRRLAVRRQAGHERVGLHLVAPLRAESHQSLRPLLRLGAGAGASERQRLAAGERLRRQLRRYQREFGSRTGSVDLRRRHAAIDTSRNIA
jgi:hypothetical protein